MEASTTDTQLLENHTKVYLDNLPGLANAIWIGRQQIVNTQSHYTITEFADKLGLVLTTKDRLGLDAHLAVVTSNLTLCPPCTRTSYLGGCSYEANEYPLHMFPFFLNALKLFGLR